MRSLNAGQIAVTIAILCFLYLIYKNQPTLISDEHLDSHHKPGDTDEVVLEGAFSQNRKSVVHSESFIPMTIPINRNSSFDYKAAMMKLNKAKVDQDDPRLVKLIRDYYIEPPSKEPYKLKNPERLEFSNGQTPFVDSRLNYMVRMLEIRLNHYDM